MNNVYPVPAPPVAGEDEFTRADAVAEIVDLVDNGAREGYGGFNVGDKLSKEHVTSITQATLEIEAPQGISTLYDEIEAEKTRLEGVHPCEFETLTAYKAALGEQIVDLDVDTCIDRMKIKLNVSTWAELQEWCSLNYNQGTP